MATSASRRWQALDAVAYAVVTALLAFLSGVAVSLVVGGGWFAVEAVMFVEGWILFGYGTFRLRPTPPWKKNRGGVRGKVRETLSLGDGNDTTARSDSRVERIVDRLPGIRERLPHPDDRFPMGVKLFLAGITVLASSFLLERAVVV